MRHYDTLRRIPFLNGGLFECLDKEDKDDPKKILRIDGFSDRADNQLSVPNFLFFSEEREVDLNKVYDTKGRRYKVRGLIDILRRYKFTITENTPIEEEVALDPELLGKVFENLLAAYNPETGATARKQTGSFYTPREIVNYMVDESLIAYFQNTVGSRAIHCPSETKLRHLFAYNDEPHQFTDAETEQLINAIDTLKILDPACGSGAFPMGILHKLVFILGKLDPRNDQWRQRQIAKVDNLIDMAEEIDDSTVRRNTIRDLEQEKDNINEAFERNELDYGRKLYLIENCIYGVDIQPVAVQIAKLRFFISLVVDQRIDDTQENRGVRPLPNLETKFVAGNTLIGVEKPAQLLMRNPEIDRKETELGGIRRKHFTARTPRTKEKYRNLDQQIRAEISQLLKSDGFPSETTEKIANWDPYDQNAVADFFDAEWMFGITEGFDVVIGNPPYVDSENMKKTNPEERQFLAKTYVTAKGNWDLYVPFWEVSFRLIHEKGVASLITPNKWLSIGYGKGLRQFSKSFIYKIVDYSGFRVFETAGVFPVVVFMSQGRPNSIYVERYSENHDLISSQKLPTDITKKFEKWGIFLSENLELLVTIMERGKRLSEYCDVEEAFTVSEAYRLTEYLREFSPSGDDIFKFVNTGTIDPFISLWGRKKTTYLKQKYDRPVVSKESFRRHFEKRYTQTICPKIIISGIRYFEAFLDTDGEWIAGKSTVILRNFRGIPLKLMMGILNSRLVSFFLKGCYGSLAMDGGINFSPANVSEIPIPNFHKSKDTCDAIVEMVNQIISVKSADIANDVSGLEQKVNQYVYDLYELTSKEVAIVEAAG